MLGTPDIATEIALELSLLQRKAHDRLRARALREQLGEAWIDLEKPEIDIRPREEALALLR